MSLAAQVQNNADAVNGLPIGLTVLIALAGSTAFVALIWKLGVIRAMTSVQTRRQQWSDDAFAEVENHPDKYTDAQRKAMNRIGRKALSSFTYGTGHSATISFLGMFWVLSFCLIMFLLIIYT